MRRHRLPEVGPLKSHEVGDLGALEVDDGEVLSGRCENGPALAGSHDDGALPWSGHRTPPSLARMSAEASPALRKL
jgi:hypothetical protein